MLKKKKKHGEEEAGEAWLLPYSDLMTLLLAVFIVLFAVSKVDQVKAAKMAEEFTENMIAAGSSSASSEHAGADAAQSAEPSQVEVISQPEETSQPEDEKPVYMEQQEFNSLEELKLELDVLLQNEDMPYIVTKIDKRGLVISLNNAILFESGSAEVIDNNKGALINIAEMISTLDNYIRIEGHTDNIPIRTSGYPSNWELSTARAASVVRLFTSEYGISPEKVVAVGYGEHKPIADNSTEEGRAKNRRIDIIVLSEKYDNLEQHIIP